MHRKAAGGNGLGKSGHWLPHHTRCLCLPSKEAHRLQRSLLCVYQLLLLVQDVDYEPHYKYYVKVIKSFRPLKNEEVSNLIVCVCVCVMLSSNFVPPTEKETTVFLCQLELSVGDKVIVTDSRNGARYIKGEVFYKTLMPH